MKIAIYDKTTGRITRRITCIATQVEHQCKANEEYYLNAPDTANYIIDCAPICIRDAVTALADIRSIRTSLLASCDWTQTLDAPLSLEKKAEWAAYRQELRAFPITCNLSNPIWPTPPQ